MMQDMNVYPDYDAMSRAAAAILYKTVAENPQAIIVLATGHSPLGAYRLFRERVLREGMDISRVTFVKLDEWLGLSPDDPATCEYFLRKELLAPLHIREEKYLHVDPAATDPAAACATFDSAYRALGRVDLVILGIGKNGHLGLNEPGSVLLGGTHCPALAEKTKTHEMLTHTTASVEYGLTMGMQGIFRGERILLLADGKDKAEVVTHLLTDEVTTQLPVSLLKLHNNCICLVNGADFPDIAAAVTVQ